MSPPLILIHGASGNAATWDLGPWSRAAAVDLPGRGGTPGPPLDRIEAMAEWLVSRLGTQRPVLVGHSMGGAVALQVALDHADAIRGIVLVASSSRLRVAPAILEAVAAATDDAPMPLDFAFPPGTDPAAVARYASRSHIVPAATSAADWAACNAFDVRHRLRDVSVPVLVVYGDQDPLTAPKYQRMLADALPDATLRELPGLGHMAPFEDPARVASAVRSWLNTWT